MVLIRAQTAITFWQTAVTAYFRSTLFASANEDKYLSQDLTSILHNTLRVSGGRETGGRGGYLRLGGRREPASLLSPGYSKHGTLKEC